MRASVFYRLASVLLVLFAVGHTLGFRRGDPGWGAGSVVAAMQLFHFNVGGFSRTYWDFFLGFGYFVSVFVLFAAALTWQFGGLPAETLVALRGPAWGLAISFATISVLAWKYFFAIPMVFTMLITACLVGGAWFSAKRPRTT